MTARLIGLGGKLRSGKDAVADHLVETYGFVKIGMSDALHEAMLVLDPIVEVEQGWDYGEAVRYSTLIAVDGYVEAKKRPEVRRLLQQLGTEVGRDMIDENVWVDIIARKINVHLTAGTSVAVTGLRFLNELTMVRTFAGQAWWIDRPGLEPAQASTHASENGVTGSLFDRTIVNDGTLEDLYAKVDGLVT